MDQCARCTRKGPVEPDSHLCPACAKRAYENDDGLIPGQLTLNAGWAFARCAACTKAGKYPANLDHDNTSDCSVCGVKLHPLVAERLAEARSAEQARDAELAKRRSEKRFADVPSLPVKSADAYPLHDTCAKCKDPIVKDYPDMHWHSTVPDRAWKYSCPKPWWKTAPDHVPDGRPAEVTVSKPKPAKPQTAVKRELAESRYAGTHRTYERDADGRQRAYPDHEAEEKELDSRQSRLAGDILDRLDREQPTWAVSLPADLSGYPWHANWAEARREYVTGDDSALDRVYRYATRVNPPLAQDVGIKPARPPVKSVEIPDRRAMEWVRTHRVDAWVFASLGLLLVSMAVMTLVYGVSAVF